MIVYINTHQVDNTTNSKLSARQRLLSNFDIGDSAFSYTLRVRNSDPSAILPIVRPGANYSIRVMVTNE